MAVFHYRAVDQQGKTIDQQIDADSATAAKRQLSEKGITVFEISEIKLNNSSKSIAGAQKALIIRQIATLLNAGYPLEKALKSCQKQHKQSKTQALIQAIHTRVIEGIPFYQALSSYPRIFNHTFCATVKAGEASGHLNAVLERLADYSENNLRLKDAIRQALIYPIILTVVSLTMVVYLLLSVVPSVVKVFTSQAQKLPMLTQYLLDISAFLQYYGMHIFIGVVVLLLAHRKLLNRPQYRARQDDLLLKMPIIGAVVKLYYTANYATTLAILLKSGVKLLEALNISAQTIANKTMQSVAQSASEEVQKGKPLALSLMPEKHVFPSMLIELIDSGERTGQLTAMLEKAGQIYEQQSQAKTQALIALLAPLMILLMGGVIFVIVLAILLPIFNLNQIVQ